MRSTFARCAPLFFFSFAAVAVHDNVSPIEKAVELLSKLKAQIEGEAASEKKLFDAYMSWCAEGGRDKKYEIKTSMAEIESLEATIAKATSNVQVATEKINTLGSALAANSVDLTAATDIREKAAKEFVGVQKELVETLDTIERAINILQRKLRGSTMLQSKVNVANVKDLIAALSAVVDAAGISLHDRTKLLGFVQSSQDDDDAAYAPPAPKAYEGHSEGIVDVLEDLKQKAAAELQAVRTQEANDKHAYEMLKQSLSEQMKADEADLSSTKSIKAEASETLATASKDLGEEKKMLADAKEVLQNMGVNCAQRKTDNEEQLAEQAQALKAIATARTALLEKTAGAAKITYGASLLQVASVNDQHSSVGSHLQTHADLANFEVVNLLRKLAREQKSMMLQQLATRISTTIKNAATAGEDPFSKVRAMIKDMIEKIEKEAGAEATQKAYCDKELGDSEVKVDELTAVVGKLSAKIDKTKAGSVTLKDEVAQLQSDLLALTKLMAAEDENRAKESALYAESKKDLTLGLEGVRMAMKVLRDFFAETPAAAALVQKSKGLTKHSQASGADGIIALLEVVEADMSRNLASIEMAEQMQAASYKKTKQENQVSKMMMQQDLKYKAKEATSLDKTSAEAGSDLESAQSELDAVLASKKEVLAMCSTKPLTYAERQTRREAEIAGLKEAMKILEGEAVFVQSHSKHGLFAAARKHVPQ